VTATEMRAEALGRATSGQSLTNYPAIYAGFMAKGIPEDEIRPRENVLTFQAWKALGRHVRKGEHGVKVITVIVTKGRPETDGAEPKVARRPWTTTVFHISQTEPAV
jgi:hypothetical protein